MTDPLKASISDSQMRFPLDRERVQTLSAQMVEREQWPRARLLAYQEARLRETVQHAVANSPYYREVIGEAAQSGGIRLQSLPILTKSKLMEQFDRIVTDRRLRLADVERHLAEQSGGPLFGNYLAFATGGTTGERSILVYDPPAWEFALGNVLRWIRALGVTAETRVLGIGAPTSLHMTNRMFIELQAGRSNAPRLAVTVPLPQIVDALNAYQPELLITYPSLIRRLAEEQVAGRLRILPWRFCSTAETLTQDVRDLVRGTWGATVLNAYGTTETGLIGTECRHQSGVHVAEDLLVLEVVDRDNRPVAPGVTGGKVLITTLFNRCLPLIRYEFSDLAIVADGSCACGRPHFRLASTEGRREDVLNLPARDGGRVSVHALRLRAPLLRTTGVRQFQVQLQPDGLLIRVALGNMARADDVRQSVQRAIQAELDQIGAAVKTLQIDVVDQIARAGTGAKEKLVNALA